MDALYKDIKRIMSYLIPKNSVDPEPLNGKFQWVIKGARFAPWIAISMITFVCLFTGPLTKVKAFVFVTSMIMMLYVLIASWILKKLGRNPMALLISTLAIAIRGVFAIVMFYFFMVFISFLAEPTEEELKAAEEKDQKEEDLWAKLRKGSAWEKIYQDMQKPAPSQQPHFQESKQDKLKKVEDKSSYETPEHNDPWI